jgi:hypothetical protein
MKLVAPNTPCPPDIASRSAPRRRAPKYMQPVQLEGLRIVVKKFIDEGAKANIKRWVQAWR